MAKKITYEFSPRASGYLRDAGWMPTRSVSVTPYSNAYAKEGLELSPVTKSFLGSFGGLLIRYAAPPGHDDVLAFTADDAVRNMGRGVLAQTEEQFGVGRLCPLGYYLYGMCLLLQAEDGKVFGLSDDRTMLIGKSGEESTDNVLSGREPQILESEFLTDLKNSEHGHQFRREC